MKLLLTLSLFFALYLVKGQDYQIFERLRHVNDVVGSTEYTCFISHYDTLFYVDYPWDGPVKIDTIITQSNHEIKIGELSNYISKDIKIKMKNNKVLLYWFYNEKKYKISYKQYKTPIYKLYNDYKDINHYFNFLD